MIDRSGDRHAMGLRERKKILTMAAIEDAALRLFLERGYEQTSIQDIADAVVMSPRTFFRYLASKEDVLFEPTREVLDSAVVLLAQRSPNEPLYDALQAVLGRMAAAYQEQRERFYMMYQVLISTPMLASSTLSRFVSIEPELCDVIAEHWGSQVNNQRIPLIVATTLTAFRVAALSWLENKTEGDLSAMVQENLQAIANGLFM